MASDGQFSSKNELTDVGGVRETGRRELRRRLSVTSGNDQGYANIINVPSVKLPSMDRIKPFDPLNSYLMQKMHVWDRIRELMKTIKGGGD